MQLYMCMLVHTFLPSIMCTVNKLDTASYRNKETHRPSSSALGPPQSGPQVPWKQSLFISVGGVPFGTFPVPSGAVPAVLFFCSRCHGSGLQPNVVGHCETSCSTHCQQLQVP